MLASLMYPSIASGCINIYVVLLQNSQIGRVPLCWMGLHADCIQLMKFSSRPLILWKLIPRTRPWHLIHGIFVPSHVQLAQWLPRMPRARPRAAGVVLCHCLFDPDTVLPVPLVLIGPGRCGGIGRVGSRGRVPASSSSACSCAVGERILGRAAALSSSSAVAAEKEQGDGGAGQWDAEA